MREHISNYNIRRNIYWHERKTLLVPGLDIEYIQETIDRGETEGEVNKGSEKEGERRGKLERELGWRYCVCGEEGMMIDGGGRGRGNLVGGIVCVERRV